MTEKLGKTLLLLVFLVLFVMGARMALKVTSPYIRKASSGLADVIDNSI